MKNIKQSVEKRLGEVALRVNDMQKSVDFYRDVVGLTLMRQEKHMAFFSIAPGYKGHTSILALFLREGGAVSEKSTLDHIAFSISLEDYTSEKERLNNLGFTVNESVHNWVQWRGMYIYDPEGNEVEFVCYDPSIPKNFES